MASVDMHDIDLKEFNEVLAACKGDASSSALPS